jgi:hypothetical protein
MLRLYAGRSIDLARKQDKGRALPWGSSADELLGQGYGGGAASLVVQLTR